MSVNKNLAQAIAQLYGHDKVASEEEEQPQAVDLENMTAADFLKGIEDGSIVYGEDEQQQEKTSSELKPEDLENMTGRELLELYAREEEVQQEKQAAATLSKLAESGELDSLDLSGRVMAHAFWDEFNKLASEQPAAEEELDLDNITGAQLAQLLESGEYELVNETQEEEQAKTASPFGTSAGEKVAGAKMDAAKGAVRKAIDAFTAKRARKGIGQLVKARGLHGQAKEVTKRYGKEHLREGAKATGLAYGALGATGAAGYGAAKLRKKMKSKKMKK